MFRLQLKIGLGLGFRDRVRIRNIIGGAAGAHISMTSYTFTHVWFASRKTPVCYSISVGGLQQLIFKKVATKGIYLYVFACWYICLSDTLAEFDFICCVCFLPCNVISIGVIESAYPLTQGRLMRSI